MWLPEEVSGHLPPKVDEGKDEVLTCLPHFVHIHFAPAKFPFAIEHAYEGFLMFFISL